MNEDFTNPTDPKAVVLQFNQCINNRDILSLASFLTEDHQFIDAANQVDQGKAACIEAWKGFFSTFPDYKNIFTEITSDGNLVTIAGHSTCSEKQLEDPALWTAKVVDGRVSEWRVYEDTTETRKTLGILT